MTGVTAIRVQDTPLMNTPGKTQVESTAKSAPAFAAGPQPALPEKQAGPLRPAPLQRAAAPRRDNSAMLMESGLGGAGRARAMRAMQSSLGNAHVSRLLDTVVQPKLTVGAPNDIYEREAKHVASAVTRMPESATAPKQVMRQAPPSISRRMCPTCQQELSRQAETGEPARNDKLCPECRQRLQQPNGGARMQAQATLGAAPQVTPEVEDHIAGSRGGGQPLPDSVRASMEPRFGQDFSAVRVHTGPDAGRAARSLNAQAFTTEQDIHFGEGRYQPDTEQGQRLLAHELAHVLQQDRSISPHTIRRVGMEDPPFGYFPAERELLEREAQAKAERERSHQAWVGGVNQQFGRDLANQSRTIGDERERIELALTAQRAAAMDAVASGQGWLNEALRNQGYSGPGLAEVKQFWGEALVAAEILKLQISRDTVATDARLAALQAVPAFYSALGAFARAAEEAHLAHVQAENDRLSAQYQARLEEHERAGRLSRETLQDLGGEPGAHAALGGQAIAHELLRPDPPTYLTAPPSISGQVGAASARVYAAETDSDWAAVASDVNCLGNGFATLVVASLPMQSDLRTGIEYLEQLDTRLAGLEATNPLAVRIPAVFYPKDRTISRTSEGGEVQLAPESIPWQFYLINTGVTSHEQPARSGGEWVLIDLTSSQRFENRAPASDFDSARLQQGDAVDPPIDMFSELNSRIRFPEGQLHFQLPSRQTYVLETTEPWSLSDWLSAIGMALAAIALVAAVVATGGAAAPAAVAFYAGLGAAALGVGSTLASLHEKSQQGILTSSDVDEAMISIGIDIVTATSMGLGRLVAAPRAAARLGLTGERFIALQRVTQVARAGALAGDVYQAYSLTSGLVSAFNAIENQPGLSKEERDRMRGQLVRRALISGALLAIAIRGDIQDYQAGRTLRVSHVDPDGALVAARGDADAPHQHADAPGASTAAHAAPHADVTAPVHESSGRIGTGLAVGPQSHALAAAGTGRRRDFYFCSDLCAPIVQRLEVIIAVLPRNHPEREIFQGLLSRARGASRRLKRGKLTQEEADAIAQQISSDISRHSQQSELFSALMNTDPALLATHGAAIRQRLARGRDVQTTRESIESQRHEANRGRSRGGEPTEEPDTRSPIETDVLGGFNMQDMARPSRRQQPIHFDVGNFSHTHAEALVPGLPRGLNPEVPVTLPDGTIGRADRVRFVYDSDGDRIGAHVFEIKPNTRDNVARGQEQVQGYVDGFRAEIEADLRAKGKAVPTSAPDGGPLYSGQVLTYNYDQMLAVLRALRASRRDAARLAEYEAIARQVFGAAP